MELDQDIISQMKQETDIGANSATYVAAEKNPDQHAKVLTLAEQFGASSSYAEQAYDDLKKERERIDVANKINANVPKLKNFISNPDYAAVSKDDLDILKRIELDVDGHSKLDQARTGFMYGLSKAFSGFNKVPGYLGNLSLLPENIYAQAQGKDPIQFKIENENSKYWDQEADYYKSQNPTLQKEIGEELLSGSVERAADALVIHSMAQIPQLAVIIGSAAGGFGLGGLLYTGASAAAEKSDELQKQGVGTVKGTSVGTLNGALEFVFEKIGTSKVFKSWQEAITKEFGKQTAKEFSKNFAKKMVSTYAIGATEEGLTQWSQDFVDYATGISPDMKGAGMRAFGAAALGGFMETTMTAPSGVMAGYAEYLQSEQSKTNKNFFMALGEKTNESKLKERLPGKYREYVEHLTKDGPVENVYISPEIFTEYFQSKKVDPGLMASELGIKDEFDRAVETGTDLKIPTAAMAEKLAGTEHYAGLANDVKFGPDQLSVNEEATQRKEAEDMIKEQYEAAKADKTPDELKLYEDSAKQVFEDIKRQRIETGRPKKAANYEATMWSQVLLTQGLNSKQMPFDLYKKYGLKIQNVDETQVGENIDTTEYFQSSPQSKKLGIKFSAVKVNNKITVNPLDTVSVTAVLVDSGAGVNAVVDSLKTDKKYPGVSLDAIKSLEHAAARNGATSMSISAKKLNLKLNDKVIQNYADAGFTMVSRDGEAFFVKKLDPVITYNQATMSPIGFFSQVEAEINKMDFTQMPAKDLMNRIKNIQGLKKEELEYIGLEDFLKAKDGKVTKQEVLDFIRENGLTVEQVVLGDLPKKKTVQVDEKSQWGDEPDFSDSEWQEPDDYYISDAANDSVYGRYGREGEIDKGEDDYFNEKLEKAKADAQAELEDGEELSEERIEEITEELKKDYLESLYESELEFYKTEEAGYGRYIIEENISGEKLEGGTDSSEWTWYDGRRSHEYGYNEDEAKIQWTQDLIDAGHLKSVIDKPRPDEIKFEQNEIYLEEEHLDKLMDEFRKTDAYKDYYTQQLKLAEADGYEENRITRAKRMADKFAETEIDKNFTLDSPEADFEFKMDLPEGIELRDSDFVFTITGNNVKGWKLEYEYLTDSDNRDSDSTNTGPGVTLDQAKEKAMQILSDIGYVSGYEMPAAQGDQMALAPVKTQAELDAEKFAEQNKPTKSSKWKTYSVIGKHNDGANYREFLLKLPRQGDRDFTYDSHFSGEKNFVAHARVSDTVVDGKKTLFIEEIQSDWHQQGREEGYQSDFKIDPAEIETLKAERAQILEGSTQRLDQINKENDAIEKLHESRREKQDKFLLAAWNKKHKNDKRTEFSDRFAIDEAVDELTEKQKEKYELIATESLDEIKKHRDKIEVLETENEKIKEKADELQSKINKGKDAIPDAPFKQTDAWASLVMKRMIRLAAEQGYDKVAWTPAKVHQERWGTDNVSWVKKTEPELLFDIVDTEGRILGTFKSADEANNQIYKRSYPKQFTKIVERLDDKPHWLVGSAEQRGGNADGMNIEELARARGKLLERSGERVETKDDLRNVIASTLNRERNDRSLDSLTDRVWKQMESGDQQSGAIEPRAEGMAFFYDKMIPDVTKKILKKLDPTVKIEVAEMPQLNAFGGKALSFDITQKIKDTALNEGFQLFQENRGSITFGNNRQFNINLFKGKDESTFLHESAHFFLELMGDVAQLENASEKSKQDYQTLLNWFGVESRDQITTEHHEKFARSFETYLYEGKSPSEKLKKAFQAFRQWLISIYKQVPPEQISDEVRAVFDRMLVADEMTEIDQMFGDPKLVMTEDETAAYLEASEKAKTEARDILQAELMQDLIRKKDKAYREKYDQLYAAEMEKAKAMPEFKVIEQITGDQKLSKPVIEKDYAVFKDFLPFKSTKVEGGLHPDFVADLNGFENGQAMLQAIAPYRRGIESYVSSQVVTQMKQEFPELLESPELSDEAIKAAHNKYAKKLKRLEMEFLFKKAQKTIKNVADKLIKRMPTDMQVRAQAVKIIASTKVTDLKPHLYRSAEKKYARIAAQEFKKGNFELAFDAKQKEYLNFELYDAAVDAKQDVEKAVKNFKKIFKKDEDLAKTRDIDLVNAARAILAHFGITKSDKTADAYLKDIKDYDPDTYSVVMALVNSATEKRGNYTTITYDDFSEMRNAVMAIWDLAKDRNEILIDGKVMKKQDAVDQLSARADELSVGKELPGYKKSITDSEKLGIQFLGVLARYRKVEHWARSFDGGKIGAAMKYIFKPVSDAQVQFDLARVDVFKKLEALTPLIKGIDAKKSVAAPEINYTFRNKLELLHAILHTGNESNYEKLLIGRQWGSFNEDGTLNDSKFKSMIDRLIADGTLQKSDFDFAQAIWDLNESLKPGAQRAHKKMYGHYFSDITAKPFVNQFGDYRGGYMPAIADKTMVADKAVKEAKDMTEGFNNSFMFPTTGRGFSKSRVDGYFAPLELDLNKIAGHVNQVLKFTHIEPAIKQVAGLVSDKKFAASLFKVDQTIAREMLTPWLQRSATQRLAARGMSEGADRFFTALRSRSSLQFMAVNVPNWFQNMTSIFPVMNEVESKYVMGSVKDYISDRHGFNAAVLAKSDYMKTRAGETVRDVAKDFDQIVLEKTEYDKVKDAAKDFAMFGEKVSNGIIEMITWNAAYREQIAKGKSESDAVTEADSVVRRTIGDVSPVGSSSVQALTPFGRLFTMMSGYFFNSGNQLLTEWQIAKQMGLNTKAGGKRAMMAFIMIVYAPAVVSAIIMKAFAGKGLDEDDDGEYLDDIFSLLFGQPLRFMTAMLPGGTVANTLINQFNDAPFDDRINVSPAASSTESAIRSVVSVPKAVFGEGDAKKALKDGLTTVGLLTGLPASFVGKPLGYLIDVKSGKANPAGPIDFTRGIITGKPGGK